MLWTLFRRRLVDALIVVWLVGTLSFVLLHLAPGDPTSLLATDPRLSADTRAALRQRDAFDRPLPVQYARYLRALGRADLGYSFSQHRPVADALRDALPHSLLLMGIALVASIGIGTAVGVWQAAHGDSWRDHLTGVLTGGLAAMPDVWLGTMLLSLFAAQWSLFPLNGRCDPVTCGTLGPWRNALDVLHHVALPAITLTLLFTAVFARVQRTAMRDVLGDDIVRTARAKGVPERHVLLRHALRRAARPTLTIVGLSLPALIGGTVMVERVFGWPGMGSLIVDAVAMRDYALVTAVSITGGVLVVTGSLLSDVANAVLDPRLRPHLT